MGVWPRPSTKASGTAGFLLAETLATFTISAFVLLGLVSATSVLLGAIDRSVGHVQDVDDLGRTLNAIARDVSGLSRARWNGLEPQPFVFRGGTNSLYFALADRDAGGRTTRNVIALREIVTRAGPRLMRGDARLSAGATGFDSLHFGAQRVLDTGAARLRYAYMSADAKGNERRLADWPIGLVLPRAIIIEARDRESGLLMMSLRVPIRSNADIGCLDAGQSNGLPKPPTVDPDLAAVFATPEPASTTSTLSAPADGSETPFCGRTDKDDKGAPQQTNAGTTP